MVWKNIIAFADGLTAWRERQLFSAISKKTLLQMNSDEPREATECASIRSPGGIDAVQSAACEAKIERAQRVDMLEKFERIRQLRSPGRVIDFINVTSSSSSGPDLQIELVLVVRHTRDVGLG
jgi:hypothetical protein